MKIVRRLQRSQDFGPVRARALLFKFMNAFLDDGGIMKTKYMIAALAAISMSAVLSACGKSEEKNNGSAAVVSGNAAVDGVTMSSSGTLDGQSMMVVVHGITAQRNSYTYNNINYTGSSSYQPMVGRIDITINGRRLNIATNGSQQYIRTPLSTNTNMNTNLNNATNTFNNSLNLGTSTGLSTQVAYANIYCSDYNCSAGVLDMLIANETSTYSGIQFNNEIKQVGVKFNISTSKILAVTETKYQRSYLTADQVISSLNMINPASE